MIESLRGVRVACFYPWRPFETTGAWSRFSCLWKFLIEQGAEVTLAFLDNGNNAQLKNISIRYLGEFSVINNIGSYARMIISGEVKSELKDYSPVELNFLLMYEKGLYVSNKRTGPWLDQMIKDQDIITCEYPMQAPLLSDYCKKWNKPLVVTNHDILFELHGSHPGAKERLKQKEISALRLADALVFTNDTERKFFEEHGLKGVTVLNTGDVLSVTPGNEDECRSTVRAGLKFKALHYSLFVGSAHGPNLDAVIEIRRMAKATPEMTFVVAGSCCAKIVEGNFIAIGAVSEQYLDTLYRGATLVLVPLMRGAGTSVKVFQALTYAKTVIATPVGARGYPVTDGEELCIVPTPLDFPIAIRRLMADVDLREGIGKRARQHAVLLDFRIHFLPYSEIICRLTARAPSTQAGAGQALVLVDNNLSDRVGHHFNYALSLKEQCAEQGIPFSALVKQGSADDVRSALSGHEAFSAGIHDDTSQNPFPADWGAIRSTYDFLLSNDRFAKELESGLANRASLSDVIFLPNATPRQMLGIALLLLRSPIYQTLQFVLILRYSVHLASGPIANRKTTLDKENADRYALCIEKLLSADPTGSVRLATDSEELAREYQSMAKRPIEVLPIPHTTHQLPAEGSSEVPPKISGVIRVIYLGDARDEKGFELLAAAVRGLQKNATALPVEFVFQAFISSPYHRMMAPALEELSRLKLANVHLIRGPLSSDAYQVFLHSADLVLLPYDALTYRARTSGPFVEAICANKPVVVPNRSWMSAQLGTSRAGESFNSGNSQDFVQAVLAVVSNLAVHTQAAEELGKRFREFHNPRNFIKRLMKME